MEKRKVLALAIVIVIVACAVAVAFHFISNTSTSAPGKPSSLMIYCGAGMRKPMDEIGTLFERRYGVAVDYNYAGSNTLLSQIELMQQGDAYMPGATMYIEIAKDKGFVNYEQPVAYHVPVIVFPKGNSANITCLNDLTKPGIKIVLGDPKAAACGKIAKKILEKNGIYDAVQKNVIATTGTVNELVVDICMGTADASIVWKTSLIGTENETDIVEIPEEQNIIKVIPIGTLTFSENKDYAKLFVDFVSSDEGKRVFEKYGFSVYQEHAVEKTSSSIMVYSDAESKETMDKIGSSV